MAFSDFSFVKGLAKPERVYMLRRDRPGILLETEEGPVPQLSLGTDSRLSTMYVLCLCLPGGSGRPSGAEM